MLRQTPSPFSIHAERREGVATCDPSFSLPTTSNRRAFGLFIMSRDSLLILGVVATLNTPFTFRDLL